MRVVMLDPLVLDRMGPRGSADSNPSSAQWRRALRDGGFLADIRAGTLAAPFAAIHAELAAIEAAEVALLVSESPIAWLTGTVPRAAWWLLLATFLVLCAIGQAVWGMGLLVGMAFTPVLLLPLAALGLVFSVAQEVRRRRAHTQADLARRAHGQALYAAVERLAIDTFVVETGGVTIVSAPHLAWITHRLRDLRVHRRPVEPPERGALVSELEAARERMELCLRSGAVAAETLRTDIPRLYALFSFLGVPEDRSGEGARLAAALTDRR
jgi:hypothetical protein